MDLNEVKRIVETIEAQLSKLKRLLPEGLISEPKRKGFKKDGTPRANPWEKLTEEERARRLAILAEGREKRKAKLAEKKEHGDAASVSGTETQTTAEKPKSKAGRKKKVAEAEANGGAGAPPVSEAESSVSAPKKARGRPKKAPKSESEAE